MKSVFLLVPFLLFTASAVVMAQEPSPPKEAPPDPPLMNNAPPDCQWTITYTPKTPEKEATTADDIRNRKMRQRYSPVVLAKRVLKSGGQEVVYTTYEAGIKSEAWVVGGYLYELPYREGETIHIDSRGQGDFPDVYWVSATNFRGTVELKGAKVHLYETDSADTRPDPGQSSGPRPATGPAIEPPKPPHQRAYIDAQTRLPVAVDTGTTVLTYQYAGPAPAFPTPDERIKRIMRDSAAPKKH